MFEIGTISLKSIYKIYWVSYGTGNTTLFIQKQEALEIED